MSIPNAIVKAFINSEKTLRAIQRMQDETGMSHAGAASYSISRNDFGYWMVMVVRYTSTGEIHSERIVARFMKEEDAASLRDELIAHQERFFKDWMAAIDKQITADFVSATNEQEKDAND